jgi:hypothetical protein
MTATPVDEKHPLELETPRVSVKKPEVRFDVQGEMPDRERVQKAMQNFVKDFGRTAAIYMESCIHCGMCADKKNPEAHCLSRLCVSCIA